MLPVARQDQLLVEEVGEGLVIYDQERDRAHSLNRTAAAVWRRCDGRTGVRELAAALSLELRTDVGEDVVRLALARLDGARLLLDGLPAASRRVTRRELLRRVGLAGAAAAMLPVVASVTAPTPLAAQSPGCIPTGEPCTRSEDCCLFPAHTCSHHGDFTRPPRCG